MDEQFSYEGLYRLLEERRAKRPEGSYTTYLFEKGLDKICLLYTSDAADE